MKKFTVALDEEVIEKIKLIHLLYRMTDGDVINNAVTLYAERLKVHDTFRERFPDSPLTEGRWTGRPERSGEPNAVRR